MPTELPNIAAVLTAALQRVPRDQQPLLIAFAERLAADRYRGWAERVEDENTKRELDSCARREEEIAALIESLYSSAKSAQQKLLAAHPDLLEVNEKLFAPLELEQQFALQAQGERLGALTWRAFAQHATDERTREIFLRCAPLEEASADFLESIARK